MANTTNSPKKILEQEAALAEFKAKYLDYAAECKAALRMTLTRIENLKDALDRAGKEDCFDIIESRIKEFDSVCKKLEKKGCDYNIDNVREHIKDVAGIRIVTKYMDKVIYLSELLESIPGINIAYKKDYIKSPKPNGYSGIHLNCQVEVYNPFTGSRLVPIEIQIRSQSMNLWAVLEHDLKYKNANPSPQVEEKFRRIAEILWQFDDEAIMLRDYSEVVTENTESAAEPVSATKAIENKIDLSKKAKN